MEPYQQTGLFPISNHWKLGSRAQVLAVAATGGYFCFLPFATSPDLATFLLICLGLLAVNQAQALQPNLRSWDYLVIVVVLVSTLLSAVLSRDVSRGLDYFFYLSINLLVLVIASAFQGKGEIKAIALCLGLFGLAHLAILVTAGLSPDVNDANSLVSRAGLMTLVVPNDGLIVGLCFPALTFVLIAKDRWWTVWAFALMGVYFGLALYTCFLLQSKVAQLSIFTAGFAMVVAVSQWAETSFHHWLAGHWHSVCRWLCLVPRQPEYDPVELMDRGGQRPFVNPRIPVRRGCKLICFRSFRSGPNIRQR